MELVFLYWIYLMLYAIDKIYSHIIICTIYDNGSFWDVFCLWTRYVRVQGVGIFGTKSHLTSNKITTEKPSCVCSKQNKSSLIVFFFWERWTWQQHTAATQNQSRSTYYYWSAAEDPGFLTSGPIRSEHVWGPGARRIRVHEAYFIAFSRVYCCNSTVIQRHEAWALFDPQSSIGYLRPALFLCREVPIIPCSTNGSPGVN
jgi:hypothetical protein